MSKSILLVIQAYSVVHPPTIWWRLRIVLIGNKHYQNSVSS
jgi:hypothetical protein